MNKQKDIALRNNPGIYKRFKFEEETGKWIDTGKFRALRRIIRDGGSKKEQAVFDNLEDAKAFRVGGTLSTVMGDVHRNVINHATDEVTFGGLVEEWKEFHYLQLEPSTQQTYDKRLPNLDFLRKCPVRSINAKVVDELIKYWVKHHPKKKQRENFEKELNLLKVVLNFYRKRKDPTFIVPVLLEHYKAADIAKKAKAEVVSLTQEELRLFLNELKNSKTPFYPLALSQFCLGLRIGEVCGMTWDAVDLDKQIARIECTIVWDQYSFLPKIKKRPKNGKIRYLVMPDTLVQELRTLKENRNPEVPFLFHKRGEPFNRQSVAKAYSRALERIGITHISGTHWVRKTSATLANQVTGDFYAVSRLMDHSSPNVTLRYVAPTNSEKKKVADALNTVVNHAKENPEKAAPVPLCPLTEDRTRLRLIKSII